MAILPLKIKKGKGFWEALHLFRKSLSYGSSSVIKEKYLISYLRRSQSTGFSSCWTFSTTQCAPKINRRLLHLIRGWTFFNGRINRSKDGWAIKGTRAAGAWQDQRLTVPISVIKITQLIRQECTKLSYRISNSCNQKQWGQFLIDGEWEKQKRDAYNWQKHFCISYHMLHFSTKTIFLDLFVWKEDKGTKESHLSSSSTADKRGPAVSLVVASLNLLWNWKRSFCQGYNWNGFC